MNYQQSIIGGWALIDRLGEGSYGTVYLARRTLGSYTEEAAIKHISIPKNEAELNAIREEHGPEESSVFRCLDEIRDQIIGEYQQMRLLQGHTNIVACHDIECCPKQDGPGYDIYIRMELLESVSSRITAGRMNCKETIKLGMDICRALMLLSQQEPGIIHRDIKPQNLFVNANGDYKLGDFGTARSIAGTSALMSVKGTYAYMAPEVLNNQPVSFAADIYSLGLVMYRLMNENRAPFVNQGQGGSIAGSEASNMKRLQGVQLPAPAKADRELAAIILKACAFEPRDRWQSAEAMLNALELLTERTVERHDESSRTTGTVIVNNNEAVKERESRPKNKHPVRSAIVFVACLVLLVVGIYWGIRFLPEVQELFQRIALNTEADQITTAEMVELQVGEYHILAHQDGTCTITRHTGTEHDILIPQSIEGYRVVEIGPYAFYDNDIVEHVYIPGTVLTIGDWAFARCNSLVSISLEEGLQRIGDDSFRECKQLASVILPESLTEIDRFAFYECDSLVSIRIPNSVTQIGVNPFIWCTNLSEIIVSDNHPCLAIINGALIDTNKESIICYLSTCSNEVYVIPDGIITIEEYAFCNNRYLNRIVIPNSVCKVGQGAFRRCYALTAIDVAFDNEAYMSYEGVLVNRSSKTIICYPINKPGDYYRIPDGITAIAPDAFSETKICDVDFPNTLTSIGETAFAYTRLQKVSLPSNVELLGNGAFNWCAELTSITIPESLLSIGTNPFIGCVKLTEVHISPHHPHLVLINNLLIRKEDYSIISYINTSEVAHVTVPYGVTAVESYAFYYCRSIEVLELPETILSLGDYCFENCPNLSMVILPNSLAGIGLLPFDGSPQLTLLVKEGSYAHQYAEDNSIPFQIK